MGTELLGFDVNENQAALTVKGLNEAWRAGFRHCGVRVTMGLSGAESYDQHGEQNWRALIKFGRMPFFAYSFARPQPGRDGQAECDHLLDTVAGYGGFPKGLCLPPVCDAEWDGGGDLVEFHRRWAERASARTRYGPGIYSGGWFWRGAWARAAAHYYAWSWPSNYTSDWRSVRLEGFAKPPWLIQRSGDGSGVGPHAVPGVGDNMDVSVFLGTEKALRAHCMGAASASAPDLKHGMRGAAVERLSRNLHFLLDHTGHPYFSRPQTSFFTDGLGVAVKSFQREHKQRATGAVNAAAWKAISTAIIAQKSKTASADPVPMPRRGQSTVAWAAADAAIIAKGAGL